MNSTSIKKRLEGAVNSIILVKFIDHSITDEECDKPFDCEAVGELVKLTPEYITLRFWRCKNVTKNDEFVHLVRSAITDVQVLKRKEGK